jgi:hypothetical protein
VADTAFGITADLIRQFPELQKVFDLWKAGNTTDAELEYYKTSYYKNLTTNAQTRQKKRLLNLEYMLKNLKHIN